MYICIYTNHETNHKTPDDLPEMAHIIHTQWKAYCTTWILPTIPARYKISTNALKETCRVSVVPPHFSTHNLKMRNRDHDHKTSKITVSIEFSLAC